MSGGGDACTPPTPPSLHRRVRAARERVANETGTEETAPRWRSAARGAHGAMESNGVPGALPPHRAATEAPLRGYRQPGRLSHEGCPWSCPHGCPEPPGIHAGCPRPAAPQGARDEPRHPKGSRLLLPPPKNGQPKGWAEPPKERPRWAEAVLGPLALYSHAYHRYPIPFPTESKPHGAADGDPKTFRHCPFLVSSVLPAEPRFGGTEGVTGADWHLGSYMPTWGQPLYLGVPPTGKAAPNPFSDCSGSGNGVRVVVRVPHSVGVGVRGDGVNGDGGLWGLGIRGDLRSVGIWVPWEFGFSEDGVDGDGDPRGSGVSGDGGLWGFGVYGNLGSVRMGSMRVWGQWRCRSVGMGSVGIWAPGGGGRCCWQSVGLWVPAGVIQPQRTHHPPATERWPRGAAPPSNGAMLPSPTGCSPCRGGGACRRHRD